jgi:flagellar hook-basal body complex protein FliE
MSSIGSISSLQNPYLSGLIPSTRADAPVRTGDMSGIANTQTSGVGSSFGNVIDSLVSGVDAKETEASKLTKDVLLGKNDQLHQSMIAMQEASTAFGLMIQVRNKVVDSYQELMRMPA